MIYCKTSIHVIHSGQEIVHCHSPETPFHTPSQLLPPLSLLTLINVLANKIISLLFFIAGLKHMSIIPAV